MVRPRTVEQERAEVNARLTELEPEPGVQQWQGQLNSTKRLPVFDLTVVNTNDVPSIAGTPSTLASTDNLYTLAASAIV